MSRPFVLKITDKLSETLSFRDAAVRMFAELPPQSSITFDFDGVSFVSRSFADQYQKEKKTLQSKGVQLKEINMKKEIREIFAAIARQHSSALHSPSTQVPATSPKDVSADLSNFMLIFD